MAGSRQLRCAIYTRKSSEEGLEQDFNSLHAQREACDAFIRSQKHEGWYLVKTAYDDGGISGGTMERPALQRLLADIKNRLVDVVVVYKVDRLTRSLADFTRMVELFDAHDVSFVSVTQQFNTTSSMGRLTLNVLLSFAQFEREVTGERIRDKIKASKQKGIWMGGNVPLGYDVIDRKLIINDEEAKRVRHIYQRYLELGCVRLLQKDLTRNGIYPKTRASRVRTGGINFSRGGLYHVLANPIYIGKLKHKESIHPGLHEAIIAEEQWHEVQETLAGKTKGAASKLGTAIPSLLLRKLHDENGVPLATNFANKKGQRYRYYISRQLKNDIQEAVKAGWRIPAQEIENRVSNIIAEMLGDQSALSAKLVTAGMSASHISQALQIAATAVEQLATPSREAIFNDWLRRVDLARDGITVTLTLAPITQSMNLTKEVVLSHTVSVIMKRRGCEMRLVIENEKSAPARIDETLIRTIARAHCWFDDLATGKVASITDIAQREGVGKSYVGDILKLAFLPPALVEKIVEGKQPASLVTDHLLKNSDMILGWDTMLAALYH